MKAGNFSAAVIGMFKNDRLWGDFQALENALFYTGFLPRTYPKINVPFVNRFGNESHDTA